MTSRSQFEEQLKAVDPSVNLCRNPSGRYSDYWVQIAWEDCEWEHLNGNSPETVKIGVIKPPLFTIFVSFMAGCVITLVADWFWRHY